MNVTIENIINHIRSVKKQSHNNQGICLLLGAGADISSGGILFRELKISFLKQNGHSVSQDIMDNKLDEEFEKVVGELSQSERCETLDKIMRENSAPSEGYELLVMLAEMGYIDAVITTNFDYLLEETQNLLNIKPFTIFTPGRAVPQEYYKKRNKIPPIYLKMHGDLNDRLVTHLTNEELENKKYGKDFIELFKNIIQKNSILIIGYSGYDSLITDIIKQEIKKISDVYWCNISEPDETSDLVSILKNNNKLKYVNISFDKLFQKLSMTFLKDAKLKNANPIFLPTVVNTKIKKQRELYENKIKFPDIIISRIYETEQLEKFLQTFNKKCVAITGKYKTGKTCFLYKIMESIKDITFFPIVFDMHHGVLENIALALGYETNVSFSLMYNFLNWWNQKKEHLVFIIDDLFNEENYNNFSDDYYIELFNFINISHEFKYIQFIISFQDDIYVKIKDKNIFEMCGLNKFTEINIKKFSDTEIELLLKKYGKDNSADLMKHNNLLSMPYVWEIIKTNDIDLSDDKNFFELYIDTLYQKMQNSNCNITKHALNSALMFLANKQLFQSNQKIKIEQEIYDLLQSQEIINDKNEIRYPDFLIYFGSQFFLKTCTWNETISDNIIPIIQKSKNLTNLQIQTICKIFSMCKEIDDIGFVLAQLNIITINGTTPLQNKIIINTLYCCYKNRRDLFVGYIKQININNYTLNLQKCLLKLAVELCPILLSQWNYTKNVLDKNELDYSAFIFKSDLLYQYLKNPYMNSYEYLFTDSINSEIGIMFTLNLLSYWGWDNVYEETYSQLKRTIIDKFLSKIKIDDININKAVEILEKYSYNIFFNAGEDFEEQFIECKNKNMLGIINKVLDNEILTNNDFQELIDLNADINNSWVFIISNVIVIQAMKNHTIEIYSLLSHFFDKKDNIKVQHLDFFFSCLFWALYINYPCNRDKFTDVFEKISCEYDRILFMFPDRKRKASVNKFSEEFQRTFEDGFNPLAFYFYTSLYKSTVKKPYEWNCGNDDLKVYWKLIDDLSKYEKYSDMIRIVHALGQMISIYPEEGYLALEHLSSYNKPIIRKGIIRLYKENYIRFSEITEKEIKKNIFNFTESEIDEIIYNTDSFLENRTLEQLHWARIFYNLEKIWNVNISKEFLKGISYSNSCSGFLNDFLRKILTGNF